MNPSGDEISAAGHSSHASYHRARKRQERLDAWENRNAANSTAPSERASRLPAHLDHEYCGSYTQRALHQVQQEAAPAPPPSLIPAGMTAQDIKNAKESYSLICHPYAAPGGFRERQYARFGAALHIISDRTSWEEVNEITRRLIIQISSSEEAATRFS
jgi:hypothetical protein